MKKVSSNDVIADLVIGQAGFEIEEYPEILNKIKKLSKVEKLSTPEAAKLKGDLNQRAKNDVGNERG